MRRMQKCCKNYFVISTLIMLVEIRLMVIIITEKSYMPIE